MAQEVMHRTAIPTESGQPVYIDEETGQTLSEKPEEMTHLRGNHLVKKTHPRIFFRGKLDRLMAEILCLQASCQAEGAFDLVRHLQDVLDYTREILGAEVKEAPLAPIRMEDMDAAEIRHRSHDIRSTMHIDHPVPSYTMGACAMALNRLRTLVRETELAAAAAFANCTGQCSRTDIVEGLNRLSSYVYILFCREAAKTIASPEEAAADQSTAAGPQQTRLITETEAAAIINALAPEGHTQIQLDPGAVITPQARDVFRESRVEIRD